MESIFLKEVDADITLCLKDGNQEEVNKNDLYLL